MAAAPAVRVPVKADPAHIIGTIDVICRHLSALREELIQGDLPDGALTRVRALHEAADGFCLSCGDTSPCRTIRALNGEVP
jgi:hypothetical protein